MRNFVVGDVHGAYKALKQVLELSSFDYDSDTLISLGDTADSWSQVPECFDELLKIKNLVYVMGNHDEWLLQWFISKYSYAREIWTSQGGQATIDAYQRLLANSEFDKVESHQRLLQKNSVYYYVDENNNIFVHGGFDWKSPINEQHRKDLTWDRHLWETAVYWQLLKIRGNPTGEFNYVKNYNEVFIGHTTTSHKFPDLKPVHASNVWNLDQGAGWEGKLTLMNVDTKEYWQSDLVKTLYPDEVGR